MARSNKRLDLEDGVDDAPIFVDANTSNTLSQDEYDRLLQRSTLQSEIACNPSKDGGGLDDEKEAFKSFNPSPFEEGGTVTKIGTIGGKRKKRTATVVRSIEEEHPDHSKKPSEDAKRAQTRKPKKIKVSFEADENE